MTGQAPLRDEASRLEVLRRYHVLDTSPEEAFDDLVHIAGLVCRTPISLISLVDRARQWFKAKEGLVEWELPRESAFCAHAIQSRELMVVPDTYADSRFRENPLVQGPPEIRFYAGAPLVTPDGYSLGTLCVIDRVPRLIGPEETRALRGLAREVMTQLELRRTVIDLAERTEELDAFSHAAAHDLRAPLRAMTSLAEMTRADYTGKVLSGPGEEWLGNIAEAGKRLDRLITSLLEYARVSRVELPLENVLLGPLIEDVLRSLEPEIQARHARIVVAPSLPPVRAHRTALFQAISNLFTNALKFAKRGDAPAVLVTAVSREGRVILSVADEGIGIPRELQDRLFKPFSRLHGDRGDHPGSGLGLVIVQKAVARMGGRAGVESEEGKGSRFWVELAASDPA